MLAPQPHQSALYGQNMVTLVLVTIVLVFSVAGVSSLDQEDDLCSLHSELDIDTSGGFHFFDIPHGATGINFKVQADKNARIILSTTDYYIDGYYIVIIGRDGDTRSAIRECYPCDSGTIVATDDFLNPGEFRRFWIIFGTNMIKVGREDDETPFMSWDLGYYPRNFSYLEYPVGNPAVFEFCNFVCDIDVLSPSPSVTSSSSPSVPSSSDILDETTSTTVGFPVADIGSTSILKGTSQHVSNDKEQTSHRPYQSLPGVSTADEGTTSVWKRTSPLETNYQDQNYQQDENVTGKVTLWPLAAVCVIPVIIFVAIYVTIKRKQAGGSKQTTEHSPVNKVQPANIYSSHQNGTSLYVLSDESHDGDKDTAMVDNVAYQSTDFPVPSQGTISTSSTNEYAHLTGDTIYNVAYESYSKSQGETNAGAKTGNGDSEYEYAYTG